MGPLSPCSWVLPVPLGVPPTARHASQSVIPMAVKFGGCGPLQLTHPKCDTALAGGGSPSVTHQRCTVRHSGILSWRKRRRGAGVQIHPCEGATPSRAHPNALDAVWRLRGVGGSLQSFWATTAK